MSSARSLATLIRDRVARLLPGTEERQRQTVDHALAWDRHARVVLERRSTEEDPGPLWIAVGDSSSQGIGAPTHVQGWVGQMLDLLRDQQDPRWDVLNLSVTGARIDDVIERQLPRLADLPQATLLTCTVGANDLLRGRATATRERMERLLDVLPEGTVVATLPKGLRQGLAGRLNGLVRQRAARRGLRVADVWDTTGPPWRGKYAADGFHPNEVGYREWVTAFAAPLDLRVPGDHSRR